MKKKVIRYCNDSAEWDDLVNNSDQECVFMLSHFIDRVFSNCQKVGLYEDEKLIAGVPLFFDKQGVVIKKLPSFATYLGLTMRNEEKYSEHRKITRQLEIASYFLDRLYNKYKTFSLRNSWKLRDLRAFQWINYDDSNRGQFKISLRYTSLIELKEYKSFEEYLKTVRKLRLREYSRAKNNGVLISEIEDTDALLKLLSRTYERQNLKISYDEQDLIREMVHSSISIGSGKLVAATDLKRNFISVFFFLCDKECIYYVFGANDPNYRNTGGSTYLMLETIKDAFKEKKRYFDFCGVNSPNRGDYKISFNSKIYPYFITSI